MSTPLTLAQAELLTFIRNYTKQNKGVCPSYQEMMEQIGLSSKSGVHRLIIALEERGRIRRMANRARTIEVIPEQEPPAISLFSSRALIAELARRGIKNRKGNINGLTTTRRERMMDKLADKIEQADAPCRELDISMLSAEQIGTYTRAFIENKADYLVVDGWQLRKQWMRDDIAQLTALRFLTVDQIASECESDSQYTAICYRPSEEFRAALAAEAMRARGE